MPKETTTVRITKELQIKLKKLSLKYEITIQELLNKCFEAFEEKILDEEIIETIESDFNRGEIYKTEGGLYLIFSKNSLNKTETKSIMAIPITNTYKRNKAHLKFDLNSEYYWLECDKISPLRKNLLTTKIGTIDSEILKKVETIIKGILGI